MNDIFKRIIRDIGYGEIISISDSLGFQNNAYRVVCTKGNLIIKMYSHDAIKSDKDLNLRIKQLGLAEYLNNHGISTLLPIKINNKSFLKYDNDYFLVYKDLGYKSIDYDNLTNDKVSIIASTLASIHKLNIQSKIKTFYKKIKIDLSNIKLNRHVINNINELVKYNNLHYNDLKNLCISHNDYKFLNILWDKDNIHLIDFDAMCMVNPYCALFESAYLYGSKDNIISDKYELFIKSYLNVYGSNNIDYKKALRVCMNGKLQWLEYMCQNKSKYYNDIIDMSNMFSGYFDNLEKLESINSKYFK